MENHVGLEEFVDNCWKDVFVEVRSAAVYIDQAAAECLHWYTAGKGYLTLKDAGAISVHELGMYHFRYPAVKQTKKAVIISTSGDPTFYQRTIKMILAKNSFESCTILCGTRSTESIGIPEVVEKIDYAKLQRDILGWMTSKKLSQEPRVNVRYVPIFLALLSADLFVTPTFGNLMLPVDIDITEEAAADLDRLATSLHALLEFLNAKADVYSIGQFSERIAENLENLIARQERRSVGSLGTEVSVILLDRTLDLCTPTSNNTESFLSQILCTLPHLPCHDNDIAIDMSPIFGRIDGVLRAHDVPGCLASVDKSTIDLMIRKKNILATTDQSLNSILAAKESPKPRAQTRISGRSLEKLVDKVRDTNSLESKLNHREKLQGILTVIEASNSERTSQLELLTSLEKLALQNLSVSRESSSIVSQLSKIVRTRTTRGLDLENLLPLCIHVYALAGTQIRFSEQHESQLEESLADAIFEDIEVLREKQSSSPTSFYQRTLLLSAGDKDDALARDMSKKMASRMMNVLRAVANQRAVLQDYRFLMVRPASCESIQRIGIIEQLITDVLRSDGNHEFRDLRQRSSSLISAGFNLLLRGRTKHHPGDNSWILIYVVGGIAAEEARIIQKLVSCQSGRERRVTLAGSRLLNPFDVADKFLLSAINTNN